jgi:DNA-directed RNA polymerase subunit RPC12/RpoP
MSDIKFNCPQCETHLAVDESGAGTTVACPNCGLSILVPRLAQVAGTGSSGRAKWWLLSAGGAAAILVAGFLVWQRSCRPTPPLTSVPASKQNASISPGMTDNSVSAKDGVEKSSSAAPTQPGSAIPMVSSALPEGVVQVTGQGAGPKPAADPRLSFHLDGTINLAFDTGVVKGSLQKDGRGEALKPISFIEPDVAIDSNHGLFVPYRFLTPQRRYGFGSWEWPRTGKVLDNGAAELNWAGTSDRPFNFSTVYRWKSADTLDLTVFFTPQTNLDQFELFLGSYFQKFPKAKAYVQDAGNGSAGFVDWAGDKAGDMQVFPKSEQVLPMINDGRWTFPPFPQHLAIRPTLAAPLGMKVQPESGVTILIMSLPEDCFAVSMAQQGAQANALYLSLFGKDVEQGQTLTGHARLVFGRNISDAQALQKYADYLQDAKNQKDDALMSRAEMDSLRKFTTAPIIPTKVDWISAQLPKPGADGWITLFDGKHLYGCAPSAADLDSGKVSLQNDGTLRLDSVLLGFNLSCTNVVISARVRKMSGNNCFIAVRSNKRSGQELRDCVAWFNGGNSFGIGKTGQGKFTDLVSHHSQDSYDGFFQMEFRSEGENLTLKANDRTICEAADTSIIKGQFSVVALNGVSLFKSIEARVLDKQ